MEKDVGKWDHRKDVKNGDEDGRSARSALLLDGELSNYFDALQGVTLGYASSVTFFKYSFMT